MPPKPFLIMPLSSWLLPSGNLTAHAEPRADVLILLPAYFPEVVCTSDVPVSVFSFISLQFTYKIGTVRVLLPFRFSKRKNLHSPLSTSVETASSHPRHLSPTTLHRCNLLGECVPLFFLHQLLSPLPGAYLYSLITAVLFLISDFSAASNPLAWLTEQSYHTCPLHPTTVLSPRSLSPSF